MSEKQIQIPERLFVLIIQYFLANKLDNFDEILRGINEKLDRAIERELYTKYKTAPSSEEQEKARQEYLNRKGISESFRWSQEYDNTRRNSI